MRYSLFFIFSLLVLISCRNERTTADKLLMQAEKQLDIMKDSALLRRALPRSVSDDKASVTWINDHMDWTEGFFPGSCWYLYQFSGDDKWKDAAVALQSLYIEHRDDKTTHDLGFIFNNSFGKAYRLTGEDNYKLILISAANSLISRYDSARGCIKSWDWAPDRWQFPVIIDNMMNLELLFEVSEITGDARYSDIAVRHARTTMKNHFRKDYSSYHVVDYDSAGQVIRKQTHQGYADSSAWSRGQAWGLYGYTICYRYTKDTAFLNQAAHIADYLISRLQDDKIFPWDLDAPDSLLVYKDASASCIFSSALIELGEYYDSKYTSVAEEVVLALGSPKYLASKGENHGFLLKHSVGSFPENNEVDVPLVYADYYFLEALLRLRNIKWNQKFDYELIQ